MFTWNWTLFWTRLGGSWIGKNVLKLKLQGFKMRRIGFKPASEEPSIFLNNEN
jgi:hypothetical protein